MSLPTAVTAIRNGSASRHQMTLPFFSYPVCLFIFNMNIQKRRCAIIGLYVNNDGREKRRLRVDT